MSSVWRRNASVSRSGEMELGKSASDVLPGIDCECPLPSASIQRMPVRVRNTTLFPSGVHTGYELPHPPDVSGVHVDRNASRIHRPPSTATTIRRLFLSRRGV